MRTAKTFAAAALALALALPTPAKATSWLRPLFLKRATYGESFTFIADLDDGTYVQLTLSVTNLGPGSTKGICRGVVIPAEGGGPAWKASDRTKREAVSWVDRPDERLTVGSCAAWGEGDGAGAEVRLEGSSVRLTFASRMQLRPGASARVRIGGDIYQTEVLQFRAPVSATLAVQGKPARTATGAGYLDHTRSTVPPRDLARRWVRFRALRAQTPLLVLGREDLDGHFAPLWSCAEATACRTYDTFRTERSAQQPPAFRVELSGSPGRLEILTSRLLYRDAPVEDLGVLGKLVAPFTGSPITYVMRATARVDAGPPVPGVVEIELDAD